MIFALLAAACQTTTPTDEPRGQAETAPHPEFDKFRPVTIAVLPVTAPTMGLRQGVRKEVYRLLPTKRYSPFKLETVDAHITTDGKFDPGSLDWDATLSVDIDKWRAVGGTQYFEADGSATLTHKTGEVLWTAKFSRYAFAVREHAGSRDYDSASQGIAAFLIGTDASGLSFPDCPPPPRE